MWVYLRMDGVLASVTYDVSVLDRNAVPQRWALLWGPTVPMAGACMTGAPRPRLSLQPAGSLLTIFNFHLPGSSSLEMRDHAGDTPPPPSR